MLPNLAWYQDAEVIAASNTVPVTGSGALAAAQRGGRGHIVTSPHPGQACWSSTNMPAVLYRMRVTPAWRVAQASEALPKVDEDGLPVYERWPVAGQPPRRLSDFPVLPDIIHPDEKPFRLEAWRRLDPRYTWIDIITRMPTLKGKARPTPNALNMRCHRFRRRNSILAWHARGRNTGETDTDKKILALFSDAQKLADTTRGTTPGLVNPRLGEAGGRVSFKDAKDATDEYGSENDVEDVLEEADRVPAPPPNQPTRRRRQSTRPGLVRLSLPREALNCFGMDKHFETWRLVRLDRRNHEALGAARPQNTSQEIFRPMHQPPAYAYGQSQAAVPFYQNAYSLEQEAEPDWQQQEVLEQQAIWQDATQRIHVPLPEPTRAQRREARQQLARERMTHAVESTTVRQDQTSPQRPSAFSDGTLQASPSPVSRTFPQHSRATRWNLTTDYSDPQFVNSFPSLSCTVPGKSSNLSSRNCYRDGDGEVDKGKRRRINRRPTSFAPFSESFPFQQPSRHEAEHQDESHRIHHQPTFTSSFSASVPSQQHSRCDNENEEEHTTQHRRIHRHQQPFASLVPSSTANFHSHQHSRREVENEEEDFMQHYRRYQEPALTAPYFASFAPQQHSRHEAENEEEDPMQQYRRRRESAPTIAPSADLPSQQHSRLGNENEEVNFMQRHQRYQHLTLTAPHFPSTAFQQRLSYGAENEEEDTIAYQNVRHRSQAEPAEATGYSLHRFTRDPEASLAPQLSSNDFETVVYPVLTHGIDANLTSQAPALTPTDFDTAVPSIFMSGIDPDLISRAPVITPNDFNTAIPPALTPSIDPNPTSEIPALTSNTTNTTFDPDFPPTFASNPPPQTPTPNPILDPPTFNHQDTAFDPDFALDFTTNSTPGHPVIASNVLNPVSSPNTTLAPHSDPAAQISATTSSTAQEDQPAVLYMPRMPDSEEESLWHIEHFNRFE